MSAFVVGREHINYLLQAAMSNRLNPSHSSFSWIHNVDRKAGTCERGELARTDTEKATEAGQMLWDENIKSVRARYPDDPLDELPGPIGETYIFEFKQNPYRAIDPVQVLKACDCYEYQSCEHDDWENSEAKAFIDALRKAAWRVLPGYDDAKWEIGS